jgi:hypothetical protein
MAESPEDVRREFERELTEFAEANVIGKAPARKSGIRNTEEAVESLMKRTYGATEANASAENVWACNFPLEPEPPISVHFEAGEEIPNIWQEPRRRCQWSCSDPAHPWPHPLNWLRMKFFGYPRRCPLHGIRPEPLVNVDVSAILPRRDIIVSHVKVK